MEATPKKSLARLACTGCDRSFPTTDAEAMLEAIKGTCPDCGGRFELVEPTEGAKVEDAGEGKSLS